MKIRNKESKIESIVNVQRYYVEVGDIATAKFIADVSRAKNIARDEYDFLMKKLRNPTKQCGYRYFEDIENFQNYLHEKVS